jgi:hypothetical protein
MVPQGEPSGAQIILSQSKRRIAPLSRQFQLHPVRLLFGRAAGGHDSLGALTDRKRRVYATIEHHGRVVHHAQHAPTIFRPVWIDPDPLNGGNPDIVDVPERDHKRRHALHPALTTPRAPRMKPEDSRPQMVPQGEPSGAQIILSQSKRRIAPLSRQFQLHPVRLLFGRAAGRKSDAGQTLRR